MHFFNEQVCTTQLAYLLVWPLPTKFQLFNGWMQPGVVQQWLWHQKASSSLLPVHQSTCARISSHEAFKSILPTHIALVIPAELMASFLSLVADPALVSFAELTSSGAVLMTLAPEAIFELASCRNCRVLGVVSSEVHRVSGAI